MLRKTLSLLLPTIFPSWRFFKTVGPSPRIEYRLIGKGQKGDWHESHPLPEHVSFLRMLRRMVWNPARNTQLYMVSLAERLVSGIHEHSEAELNRLIWERIGKQAAKMQFRLVFLVPEDGAITATVVYESTPVAAEVGA